MNDKRALRICRSLGVRSTIQYARHGCTRRASDPQYLAENVLNREFYAEKPDEKWLTDVTEFKYYVGTAVRKLYLSAILDLCDRRIVAFVLRDANDSALAHEALDQALAANPDAHPLFHSDRGFQYTTRVFHDKLAAAGITQSMVNVLHVRLPHQREGRALFHRCGPHGDSSFNFQCLLTPYMTP